MKTATVRQFRDRATSFLKQEEPIIVTRRGKIVRFFLPAVGESLPLEIKKDSSQR
jgi:PHD/YefM family antitoxin component YafN of YafNO toxin-antitoxin module